MGRPLSALLVRGSGEGVDLFGLLEDADAAVDVVANFEDDEDDRLRARDDSFVDVTLRIREFGNGARVTGALALVRPTE